jgi:hypothetical protein
MTERRQLTPLERAVLLALINVAPTTGRDALMAQAERLQVVSRDSNSHGFMATLSVDRSVPPAIVQERRLGGIGANIPGLSAGAGFALWLEGGYVDALEGFAYVDFPNGEDRWIAEDRFELYRA